MSVLRRVEQRLVTAVVLHLPTAVMPIFPAFNAKLEGLAARSGSIRSEHWVSGNGTSRAVGSTRCCAALVTAVLCATPAAGRIDYTA